VQLIVNGKDVVAKAIGPPVNFFAIQTSRVGLYAAVAPSAMSVAKTPMAIFTPTNCRTFWCICIACFRG
jgi:hypothetical protein